VSAFFLSFRSVFFVEFSTKWELAMKNERDTYITNQTWELTELPADKEALHNK
jgi:hypothetical protein